MPLANDVNDGFEGNCDNGIRSPCVTNAMSKPTSCPGFTGVANRPSRWPLALPLLGSG